jgi:signal transduction histidine kinase
MDALIQDLLAFEELATLKLQTKALSLEEVVREVLLNLKTEIETRPAEAVAAKPLPVVQGDTRVLRQVMQHLLENALKFSRPGVMPRIQIWAEETDDSVRLCVHDNGIGIAPEHQASIFKPFCRLHEQGTYHGNGIGLAFVRRAVERMGGAVGVESDLNQGSTFWLELPKPRDPCGIPELYVLRARAPGTLTSL